MDTLDENASVISASKVTGTNVYNTDGDHLGEIYDSCSTKGRGTFRTRSCRSAAFSGLASGIMPCPGQLSSTTRDREAMWSVSPSIS